MTTAVVEVTMPRLSDSMEEATILRWLKSPGDPVARGEALVEIETDKATIVYEAESAGTLSEVLVPEGGVAALGAPIARLASNGARGPTTAAPRPRPGRARATPVARRTAAELGVSLQGIRGTGPGGRVVRADVRAAAATGEPTETEVARHDGDARVELTATQRTIARRMAASRAEIPEFTLTCELDATAALALRRELNDLAPGARVSINDLLVKAVALALREFPRLNASYVDDGLVQHGRVNVGVAVATEDALLVPTVFDVDQKSLPEIAAATREAASRAAARSLDAAALAGGTFTVSNLGMFGVTSFEAVINPPQVGILAVGKVERRPVFDEHGAVVARDLMHVSLSCDHRAVYGAEAARFLARVRELLERPLSLMLGVQT